MSAPTSSLREQAHEIDAELVTRRALEDLLRDSAAASVRLSLLVDVNAQLATFERSLQWLAARRLRRIRKPVADHIFRERP